MHRIRKPIAQSAAKADLHPNVSAERAGDALQGSDRHPT
jgi:hypothetical protein